MTRANSSQWLSLIGLYLISFSLAPSAAGRSVGIVLLLIGCIIDYRRFLRRISGQPVVWITLAFIAYVISNQLLPRSMPAGPWSDTTDHLIKASLFFISGYWLFVHKNHIKYLLSAFAAGFIVQSLVHFPWHSIVFDLHTHHRLTLGFDSISLGEVAGLAALILLFYIPSFASIRRKEFHYAVLATCYATGLWATLMLILSGTRSAWLAFALSSAFSAYRTIKRHPAILKSSLFSIFIGVVILSSAVIGYTGRNIIYHRISPVISTLTQLPEQGVHHLHHDSTGVRIQLMYFATRYWLKRPIIGWGPSTAHRLVDKSGLNSNLPKTSVPSSTFISTPFQILAEQGFIGAGLYLAVAIFLILGLLRSRKQRTLDEKVCDAILAMVIYESIFSFFLVVYLLMLGYFVMLFIGGLAFAACLTNESND